MSQLLRSSTRRAWAALALVLALAAHAGAPLPSRGAAPTPSLQIAAPARVEVGVPIELQLTVRDVADIAGYEINLLFDTRVAEWNGLRQRKNDLKKLGRDIGPLGAVQLTNGIAFGLYSCPAVSCVDGARFKRGAGGKGTLKLALVSLIADQPGLLEIAIAAPKFVAADGSPVAVAIPTTTLAVQVGDGGARHPVPAGGWTLAPAPGPPGPLDLTGDGQVTHADAMEVARAWTLSRESGAPCGPTADLSRDVNHDGCIDVADLQLVAANYSPPAGGRGGAGLLDWLSSPAQAAQQSTAATFTVNSSADTADAAIGDGICATAAGGCTLRAAIAESNLHPGADTITFNIPGSGVQTIQLMGHLPAINDASGPTTIDGYTQPGASPNTDPLVSNATIMVQIAGNGADKFDGLYITSAGNTIRGLALYKLKRAIYLYGGGAADNLVAGCFVGTDAAGTYAAPTYVYPASGIVVEQGAPRTRIGGTAPGERNVISGNARHGIDLRSEATDSTTVVNNLIGLAPAGDRRLENKKHGIDLNHGAAFTTIGGTAPGERNVISGNGQAGLDDFTAAVEISHDTLTTQNRVIGNYIGADTTGMSGPDWAANSHYGIRIEDGATNNVVSDNIIGNNRRGGVKIDGAFTSDNQLLNNRIGVALDGGPLPNPDFGVLITVHATRARVGPNNIIANSAKGVWIPNDDNDFNTITRNSIYDNSQFGIELGPFGGANPNDDGDPDSGANQGLNFPVITGATTALVSGSACAGCTVELFKAERRLSDKGAGWYGQGKTLVGSVVAGAGGSFAVAPSGLLAGDYVTATATDSSGNTSELALNQFVIAAVATPTPSPSPTPSPTPTPGPAVYAQDLFGRNVTGGWGSADLGGPYALAGTAANFDVNGSVGTIALAANATRSAYLAGVSALDVDISFTVQTDKPSAGGGQVAYVLARRIGGAAYLGRLRIATDGSVRIQAAREIGGMATFLGNEKVVPGLTHAPGNAVWVRIQVAGASPTTIRMRAWGADQTEPAGWQYSVTDSEAGLQGPGGVGLRAYLSSSATNAPVLFSFDEFRATGLPTP